MPLRPEAVCPDVGIPGTAELGLCAVSLSAPGERVATADSEGGVHVLTQGEQINMSRGCPLHLSCIARLVEPNGSPNGSSAHAPSAEADGSAPAGDGVRLLVGAAARESAERETGAPHRLALRCVAWNPNTPYRHWIACGGPAGVVLCLHATRQVSVAAALAAASGTPPRRGRPPKHARDEPQAQPESAEPASGGAAEAVDIDDE